MSTVNMNTFPLTLPGGLPGKPNDGFPDRRLLHRAAASVRKVVVTETVTAQDFGDYIGSLSDGTKSPPC